MSIYSVSVKTISRSAGRSATAAAAYRTGTEIVDARMGMTFDYSKRSGVDHVSRHYPQGVADMGTDALWNKAEAAETRKNATVARELLVALPHELSVFQRRDLAKEIAGFMVDRYQVAAEASLHLPDEEGDQRNHHVHIQFSTRRMAADGSFGEKTRELDDKKQGAKEVKLIREMVELKINQALEHAGVEARVDCRSLKDQQAAALAAGDLEAAKLLDRKATVHEGPAVTALRRKAEAQGEQVPAWLDRAAINDEIRSAVPANLVLIKNELADIDRQIKAETQSEIDKLDKVISSKRADLFLLKAKFDDYKVVPKKHVAKVRDNKKVSSLKAEAKAFREEHPWISKFSEKTGFRLKVDLAVERAIEQRGSMKETREWFNQRDAVNTEYKALSNELSSLVEQRAVLREELANDRPAAESDIKQVSEKLEAKPESGFKGVQQIVRAHAGANLAAGISTGLQSGNAGDIIRTGVAWMDELAQEFKKFCQQQEAEAIARSKALFSIQPESVNSLGLQKALEALFRVAVTLETGENHVEPGEPLQAQKLAVYADSALRQVNEAKSAIVMDVNAKQIMEERRRELERREVERKKAETEKRQKRESKYKKDGGLSY